MVVASSDVGKGGPEGDARTRSVVSASNIEASVIVATASGALRQKKLVRVWLSENIRVGLEADLVIIGGQLKNHEVARYLVFFNQMYPTTGHHAKPTDAVKSTTALKSSALTLGSDRVCWHKSPCQMLSRQPDSQRRTPGE